MEKDLLADEKECAEHVMLVDLGRNDVGKVEIPILLKLPLMMPSLCSSTSPLMWRLSLWYNIEVLFSAFALFNCVLQRSNAYASLTGGRSVFQILVLEVFSSGRNICNQYHVTGNEVS